MPAHSLNKVRDGYLPLHFWVKCRFGEVGVPQISQQAQVVMACRTVERDQFRRRRIQVVQIAGPCVLIQGRDDGPYIC